MSLRSSCWRALAGLLLAAAAARGAEPVDGARLATYRNAAGDGYFALSLLPQQAVPASDANEVVVLFDTSASQTGLYRADALSALRTMLSALNANDRVRLIAVDLNAIPLTEGFVEPQGAEMAAALQKLEGRVPLGTTDMRGALKAATESFAGPASKPRSVVYIGDGVAGTGALVESDMKQIVGGLTARQVAVSSLAIGPQRNVYLLAMLANHTGGMIVVDEDNVDPRQVGTALAGYATAPVLWPVSAKLPSTMRALPSHMPPLRLDRDTILVGALSDSTAPAQIAVEAVRVGLAAPVSLRWTAVPEASSDDMDFLPQLLAQVESGEGIGLATVGSAGLRETASVLRANAEQLAKLGTAALRRGDVAGAKQLAAEALRTDPTNPEAMMISRVDASRLPEVAAAHGVIPEAGEPALRLVNLQGGGGVDDLLEQYGRDEDSLLNIEEQRRAVREQLLETRVERALTQARQDLASDPEGIVQSLKVLLEEVDSSTYVRPDVKSVLSVRLETAIVEAARTKVERDASIALEERNRLAQAEKRKVLEAALRDQERIQILMERFELLMDEAIYDPNKYLDADQKVIAEVELLNPQIVTTESAKWYTRFTRQYRGLQRFRDLRHKNFADALYTVEESLIPFIDEPPIVYPEPAIWEDITRKRAKYKSMDLASDNDAEKSIYFALEQKSELQYPDVPLETALADIASKYFDGKIFIDKPALEAAGVALDTPVNVDFRAITLRSGLRLMLKELGLTYIIDQEVLQITTTDIADEKLVTKVYPVGDLVLPIMSFGSPLGGMGGGMGGMGGGMGGMGGMGGGMGGMGGGMGGMGGGMGGMFDVGDTLILKGPGKSTPAQPSPAAEPEPAPAESAAQPSVGAEPQKVEPIRVEIAKGESADAAWDRYFTSHDADPAAVRETVRQLMRADDFEQTAAVIRASLRNGKPESWMYEALALALRASHAPQEELERALMSAVDFSSDLESVMHIATYMSQVGLKARALQLYREISKLEPLRPEPYLLGLSCAEELEDHEAVRWAVVGVLAQSWPKEQRAIEIKALAAAKAEWDRLSRGNESVALEAYRTQLQAAKSRDCVVKVTWSGDADIDLLVAEPSGTICSLQEPITQGGGVMVGDEFSRPDKASVEGYSESYICSQGFPGVYRLMLRRVWGKVTAGKVTVDIVTNQGTPEERRIHKQLEIGDKDAVVLFDLPAGRRTEMVAQRQIESLRKEQEVIGEAILAQAVGPALPGVPVGGVPAALSGGDAAALAALQNARLRRAALLGRNPFLRGGVGYMPVVQRFPEGTNLSVTTAIASADRRYVRITIPSFPPIFSGVGDVATFNFATGAQGGQQGGGAGGVGGGPGAFGGGGLGGGGVF